MSEHTLETTITVGGEEIPATVTFEFYKGCKAFGGSRWEPATCPEEPPSVTINTITLSDPEGTPLHRKRGPVTLTDGLLFDAMCDDWLTEKCFDLISEDA